MALDINEASVEELSAIEGVSDELAKTIIEYRNESGGFTSLSEVANVPGCDKDTVDMLDAAGVSIGAASTMEDAEGSHE